MIKKVLLCIPTLSNEIPLAPYAGVGYISEYLSKENVEHIVVDMNLGYSQDYLFKKIKEYSPDLIGFFLMTKSYKKNYDLIDAIKITFDIDCVAGGPHVSTFRKKFLEECRADYGIKLEGEYPLMDLIKGKPTKEIKGLIYRDGNNIIENPDCDFITDLDFIPFPKYKKFEMNKYKDKVINIISSRGCPYMCIYCPVQTAIGRQFRTRTAINVFDEIAYWHQLGYRKFYFQDDNFTLIKKRVIELCRLLHERNYNDLILCCPNGVRADKVDEEVLKWMKIVGFKSIAFGVEGGNNKTLKALKKGETIEEIENKIKLACNMGFDVALFFLIGAPGEEESDVEDSFALALKYPIVDAFFYSIVPFPKTELYDWVERENLWIMPPESYLNDATGFAVKPYYGTKELSIEKREQLLKKGKKISHTIRKNGIVRRAKAKYGFIGYIIGYILGSQFADKYILQNRLFLKIYTSYLKRQVKR